MGNRLLKRTDKGNDGAVDEEVRSAFDQNDRLLSELEIIDGAQSRLTEYVYNKTEQIAKTLTDIINNRVESNTTMSYDSMGRLSTLIIDIFTNGVKSKTITQQYVYDSDGTKVKQIESIDANADGLIDNSHVINYLNDSQNHTGYSQVLEERQVIEGQEAKVTTYTVGHDVLLQFNAVAGALTILADGHGSTRALSDITGAAVQQYNYDAYGNAHGFDASEALTSLLYSGEQFNPVSGLQYLRARWYDPQSGRFNRLDPYAGNQLSPLSFHKYAYAHMNPIMGIDPSGYNRSILSTLTNMTIRVMQFANQGIRAAFAQGKGYWEIMPAFGAMVQNNVLITLSLYLPSSYRVLQQVALNGRRPDFLVRAANWAVRIESKYQIHHKGNQFENLVEQVSNMLNNGVGHQVMIFTVKPPSQLAIRNLTSAIGLASNRIHFVNGYENLLPWFEKWGDKLAK